MLAGVRIPSRWLPSVRQGREVKVRLFCFPYAGGNATVFHGWADQLPESIDLCPIQLPGRGARFGEPLADRIPVLAEAIAEAISPFLDLPFALFGHSLGALIAFETAQGIRSRFLRLPVRLLVSAHRAPRLKSGRPPLHHLPDADLIVELERLEGTPRQVLNDPELMALMLPTLRADFALCDTYAYVGRAPLECPITVFGGSEDKDVGRSQLEPWGEETRGELSLFEIPGGHFFIHDSEASLLKLITQQLYPFVRAVA
ncbi:MAG: thioesterase II family protein [Gammaproteobacteria bacterium]